MGLPTLVKPLMPRTMPDFTNCAACWADITLLFRDSATLSIVNSFTCINVYAKLVSRSFAFLRCIDRRHQNDSIFISVVRIIPDRFKIATDWSWHFQFAKYILKKQFPFSQSDTSVAYRESRLQRSQLQTAFVFRYETCRGLGKGHPPR